MFQYTVVLRVLPAFMVVGQSGFRGFFIQARLMADNSNIGRFVNPSTNYPFRLSSCPTSSVRSFALANTIVLLRFRYC